MTSTTKKAENRQQAEWKQRLVAVAALLLLMPVITRTRAGSLTEIASQAWGIPELLLHASLLLASLALVQIGKTLRQASAAGYNTAVVISVLLGYVVATALLKLI
ncbi:MAG: hypothetical protein Q4G35_02440 [Propionibacteriaceae bacterium]|nr:hypothetical protein [Propionibacteriaceae bacterium]